MEENPRYSCTVREPFLRSGYISGFEMFCTAKIKVLKLHNNTNQINPKGSFEPPSDSNHQNLEKWIFILLSGKNATLVRNERRKILEQLQSRATQIQAQTFNYKHIRQGKQGGAAAPGLGSTGPEGRQPGRDSQEGRKHNRPDKISLLPLRI